MNFIKTMYLVVMAFYAAYALDDASVPNIFSPNTPARSAEVNENYDSLEIAFNRLNDTLNNDFTRNAYFEQGDTNIKFIGIDTSSTIVCSTSNLIANTADINSGTIDGVTIGGSTEGAGYFDTLHSVKGITGTALNTGQGLNELYPMNQPVLTTSDVIFDSLAVTAVQYGKMSGDTILATSGTFTSANITSGTINGTTIGASSATTGVFTTINTGQGVNELYDMDQNVLTTSDVIFDSVHTTSGVTIDGQLGIGAEPTSIITAAQTTGNTICRLEANSKTGLGLYYITSGDGDTSSMYSYSNYVTNETDAQAWALGMYGTHDFKILNQSKSLDLLVIDTTGNLMTKELSSSTTPETGYGNWYAKTDGLPYFKNDAGTEYDLSTLGGDLYTTELSSGSTPSSGLGNWYCKTDGLPYFKNDAGDEIGLSSSAKGSFTFTISQGLTTTPTGTAHYSIIDSVVSLSFEKVTGITNSTSMTISGLPSVIRPSTVAYCTGMLIENLIPGMPAMMIIDTDGTILCQVARATDNIYGSYFSTSVNTKGVDYSTWIYRLN